MVVVVEVEPVPEVVVVDLLEWELLLDPLAGVVGVVGVVGLVGTVAAVKVYVPPLKVTPDTAVPPGYNTSCEVFAILMEVVPELANTLKVTLPTTCCPV